MRTRRSEASRSWLPRAAGGLAIALGIAGLLAGEASAQRLPRGGKPSTKPAPKEAMPRKGRAPQVLGAGAELWQLEVDPPAQPAPAVDDQIVLRVPPSFFGGDVVFPTAPSAFVAVGRNGDRNDVREVWNLAAKKRVGAIRGDFKVDKPFALSPDGSLFAAKATFDKSCVVFDTKTGRMVAQLRVDSPFTEYLDFAGSDRVITGRPGDRLFEVWDLKSQKAQAEIQPRERVAKDGIALSPGRKYLAMTAKNKLWVYEVATGRKVGEAEIPKNGPFDVGDNGKGLAFSNDGTLLAGLFDSFGLHVLCWDAATGQVVTQYKYDDKSGIKAPLGFEGRALDWLADNSGWLLFGAVVVDRQSGQKVFTIPSDTPAADKVPRRVIGDNVVMITVGDAQNRTVRGYKLDADKIARASKIVAEGGSAADVALPALTPTELASARRVKASTKAPAYAVAPDGATPSAASMLRRAIPLRVQANEVQGLLFNGLEHGVAGVYSLPGGINVFDPNQNEAKPRRLELYTLANGRSAGQVELPNLVDPVTISPDADRVLTIDNKEHGRVDVFMTAGQKHVAGWRPYGKESADDKAVTWAGFLSADQVLTVNKAGTLVLWSLPDCKPVYVADSACEGAPVLSPGRKFLACYLGGTVRFLDPATGETKGEAELPASANGGRTEFKGAAFPPDGAALVALVSGDHIVRWDVRTGKVTADFRTVMTIAPMPNTHNAPVECCGPNHALLDGRVLIDLEHRAHVWSYFGPSVSAGAPDGRHWYVTGIFNQPATLAPVALPEADVNRVVALVGDPNAKASLRVGSKVGLQLEFTGPPTDNAGYRNEVTQMLNHKLQANGMTVGDGGVAQVVVNIQERNTGKTIGYRNFGDSPRNPPRNVLQITVLDCEVQLADAQGRVTLSPKRSFEMSSPHFLRLRQGETVESRLKNGQWAGVKMYLQGIGLPYFVARQPDGVAMLPGVTDLNAAR
ncbi:MAG: PQQ-binding-like beta-propeller repeat protein [Isosphaeraceae bacterium]|nr:PQQ-binding-like beta-propeller repeat protein [Isosphaeraceae bacterium]